MKLYLLNPFLRYGSSFNLRSQERLVTAPDSRLNYLQRGSASIVLNNTKYSLPEHSIFYCPAGTTYRHIAENKPGEEPPFMMSLNFDLSQESRDEKVRVPGEYSFPENFKGEPMISEISETDSYLSGERIFYNAKEYQPYFLRILKEFRLESPHYRELCSCILKELLIMLHSTPQPLSLHNTQIMERLISHINNNYTNAIDNESLAALFGYHPNYLERIFKKYMNTSIQQYILNLRIAEAKRLIAETDSPLSEIALRSGFNDYPHFSAYFKKKTGLNPSLYKKQNQMLI